VSPAADITVSIVNHENREGVIACLRSLEEDLGRRAALQVIVVDNASEDGSAAAIRAAFPQVEVIKRSRRAGFGANHNLALGRATGRHILLLNDDTLARPGAIDTLVDYVDDHPLVALAAPRVVDHAGQTQPSAWEQPGPRGDLIRACTLGRRPPPMSRGTAPRRVGWALGCAVLARREVLLVLGGFDERYFMYCEEIDLSRRLALTRLETHWVPAAVFVHDGQVSTGGHASAARAVEMARSRRSFWARHYSRRGRLTAQLSTSLMLAALALGAIARGKEWRPFWLQARESWGDTSYPGLREQAAEWNARTDLNPAGDHAPNPPVRR
jgi:N-acetylglucosaminyl-diphospho-decaprenol L-rhamnosyltransferase